MEVDCEDCVEMDGGVDRVGHGELVFMEVVDRGVAADGVVDGHRIEVLFKRHNAEDGTLAAVEGVGGVATYTAVVR